MNQTKPSIAWGASRSEADLAQDKTVLREQLLAVRKALTGDIRDAACRAIGQHLLNWQTGSKVATLAVYWPIRGEPDLTDAYWQLAQRGVQLALPVVSGPATPLTFAAWAPGQAMMTDAFGVPIPTDLSRLLVPDAIAIPCVGISAQRYRLGYGGGMYDRTLALLPAVQTIGIAFDCARSNFAAAAHDVRLQSLITESGIEADH
ncbi:5-formyltetrahydrofolate cyclo-ligase [Actimicrobium sp. CCI2.3]|uniref:5-formyltetrahydrofolate cyclo-ligase n=1 Tax=Actimicrobium sp. CCI2.3 TaxID=3048616 RepID=UPI002AB463D4|nr:5-formyltetrahydrofolate cyclo-ligase [Actimicrobium sp. CCI2.3]MDY7576346.1 5-formyltetrahydrofolate cyclo-ligase [Actimicrobium sp. CCI2.3]MEB0020450.1 5-formyltetrahydrofolate cyclo-ligase [Actimicrobium sp. CCI2.3]